MLHTHEIHAAKRRLPWRLCCLLGSMILAGTAGAAQAQAGLAMTTGYHPSPLAASYRVINLGAGGSALRQGVNDRGQVAFTIYDAGLPVRAFFYDGAHNIDIGSLGGGQVTATALNNVGQIVGTSQVGSGSAEHAFVWSRKTGILDLGTLGGVNSRGADINDWGVATGTSQVPGPHEHAFRWTAASGLEDLNGSLYIDTQASAISYSGLIAGRDFHSNGDAHGFAWTRSTGLVDLGTLGGYDSDANAVDDDGHVVGEALSAPPYHWRAYVWSHRSGMHDLGAPLGSDSFAFAINNRGQVVGRVNFFPPTDYAFSWTRAGGMVNLGTFGGQVSYALDVNDQGQVVGSSYIASGEPHAFGWTAGQGMIDLNTRLRHAPAGLVLDTAVAIAENGWIVATSNAGLIVLKPDCGCPGTHAVGPIAGENMAAAGAPFEATVSFAYADASARHNVTWSWGDGGGDQAGAAHESQGAGSASGTHSYAAPGIYTVKATVTDLGGNSVSVSRPIVVYDRATAGVRGSGWFSSPQGADRHLRTPGIAHFQVIAPSTGTTSAAAEVQFEVGNMHFRSLDPRPVAAGNGLEQFEGSGTMNGQAGYRYTLAMSAGDGAAAGAPGRFGLKIWHTDPTTNGQVVDYDNLQAGSGSTGSAVQGQIVHQP